MLLTFRSGSAVQLGLGRAKLEKRGRQREMEVGTEEGRKGGREEGKNMEVGE